MKPKHGHLQKQTWAEQAKQKEMWRDKDWVSLSQKKNKDHNGGYENIS